MKTTLSFIFNLFLFTFLSFTSHAQVQATFTYADGYNICGKSNLKILLTNTSATNVYPIIAEFKLNSTMSASAFTTSIPSSKIIMSVTGNDLKLVFDTVLTSSSVFDINVTMTSTKPCALSGCGQFFSTTDTLSLKYNSKASSFYNTSILSSPCLTYDETIFSNRLTSAFLGDTIIRKLILKNTGGGKFDGYIQFKDVFGPFISIQSVYSTTPGVTVLSAGTTNDSTYIFKGNFPNILNGDSIVLIEKVIVTKCIKEDEGKSSIFIDWGCGTSLCNQVTPYPIIAQVLKNKKKPDVVITKTAIAESNCLNSKTKYIYTIKNNGTRPATELQFTLGSSNYDTYTYISKNSLVLKDTAGLMLQSSSVTTLFPTQPIPLTFQHSCTIPDPLYSWNFKFASLMPQDSFIVEAEGFNCCPGDDTSNVSLTFEAWNLQVKYQDECQEEDFSASSPRDIHNELSFTQFYEPIITDMHEGDSATFEIFNNGLSTDFYRFNELSRAFKIRIKLDTGLVYVPGSLKITSAYGYTLTPTSEQTLTGAGVDGYRDTFLETLFILPDTFVTDRLFFARFMRNSSVKFILAAQCPARIPISRFTEEVYIVPDMTCTNTCEALVASLTTDIAVHCPGCITPGWVATSHTAVRLNLGEQDNDNNRLPDNLTYTPADRSKIKNNRCIPGDTIQTELLAYFQDGDPFVGKSTQQLQNYGAKSFNFLYSYLRADIVYGKLFQLNSIKLVVTDANKDAITSGVDSIAYPLSCVTKIPDPNDSLADAQFFFDLSLDSLHKYGIPAAYTYQPSDVMRVVCNYTILEPSSFYLSNPPATTDPWLGVESASILLNSYRDLLYLTGNRETATDRTRADAGASFEKDPTSLDSTMIYWCESFGSASTIVGKKRDIEFDIPSSIQCKEHASFTVTINPSGGVFRNAFPYEYRNFIIIDSVQATVPPGYKFTDWTITNTVQKPDGFLEYAPCTRIDSIKNVNVRGPLISIPINPLYSRRTDYGDDPCLDHLVYGDESIVTTIGYSIQPDCDLPETSVDYHSPVLYYRVGPDQLKYADKMTTETCSDPLIVPMICKYYEKIPSLTKANAALKLSPVTNEIQLSQQTFCYPLNIEETAGNNANYTFLQVKSLNQKVKPEKLTNKETGKVYLPDAHGLFQLDTTDGKTVYQYELCISNICGKLIDKDTLRLIYGHDCFSYPDSVFSNICKKDSIDHYVIPATLQLYSAITNTPSEVKMCDPFEVDYSYSITGIGSVANMLLNVKNNNTSLQSATMFINDNLKTDILAAFTNMTGKFDLNQKILSIKSDGLKAGDKVRINLLFDTDCEYKGTPIVTQAVLVTSACDTLYGDSLKFIPPVLSNFPQPDNKSATITFGELKNLGGQLAVNINVANNDAAATKNKTRVTLILPSGFTYASMASGTTPVQTTDTSVVWDIAAGIPAAGVNTIYPLLNYPAIVCDSVPFKLTLSDLSVGCSGQPCVQRDTTYKFKAFVKCYPCPPDIMLSERCKEVPIYNVITWEYTPLPYCPDDHAFTYELYFSPTYSGNYTLLTSTTDKTYTHDSLALYDGCYYVKVIDHIQNLSSQSVILCKSTCREQFQCGDLFIPNMVTPNKDGSNETFEITGAYTTLDVAIYNSWGSTVFHSSNYKNDWSAKGLSDGVYYYNVHIDGSDKKCVGWVYVIGGNK